jgi:nucleotide-binding universal stress UspA family protein
MSALTSRGDQVRPDFEFQRVLVLTNFSRGANSALQCTRAIAPRFNSKLFLLHVIPSSVFRFISPNCAAETIHLAKEFAEREMQMLLDEGKLAGLVEEGIVVEGQLWPTISEAISSLQIDLIAIGTHSRTSEQKMALGSFAEQIYRMTP